MKLKVTVNGIEYDIEVEVEENERPTLGSIVIGGTANTPVPTTASMKATSANGVTAPLAGTVSKILVKEGDKITEGQVLVVLEAMKMETEITAPQAATVAHILVSAGDSVQGGTPLVDFAA